MERCKMPDCKVLSVGEFALVPLCQKHLDDVRRETRIWYKGGGKKNYEESRPLYIQISDLIPWSKPMIDLKHGRISGMRGVRWGG